MRKSTVPTLHPLVLLLGLMALVLAATACQPLPASPAATGEPEATRPAPTVTASGGAAQPVAEEEDCMAGCHIPDPNEGFDTGANPQPASHVARTTCLSCHSSPAAPAPPADHKGRMDPSCALCHKESVKPG